jgi:hypothetical protein
VRRHLVLLCLIFGLATSYRSATAVNAAPVHSGREITLSEHGLEIDWSIPPVQFGQDTEGKTEIKIDGFSTDNRPGALRLPVSGLLIAIPKDETPLLEILQLEAKPANFPVSPAVNKLPAGVLHDDNGQVIGGEFSATTQENLVEAAPLNLEPAGILRGVHLTRLIFHPVFFTDESFQFVKHIKIRLSYNVPRESTAIPFVKDPILGIVKSMVINPQHVEAVHETSLSTVGPTILPNGEVAAIEVESTGLIAVTRDHLQAIGFPVGSVNPNHLQLTRAGSEIAYQWLGDDDGIFEQHERLLFYSEPRFSRWTRADVYYLWEGDAAGLRMISRSATPIGLPPGLARAETLVEVNRIYTPDCYCAPIPAGRDGDRWVWEKMERSKSDEEKTYNFTVQLPSVDQTQTASITLWLIGFTDLIAAPDHLVRVLVNSTTLGEVTWDGKVAVDATLSIPADILKAGENTLTLALPGMEGVDFDGAWLDAFSLHYAIGANSNGESILFSGLDTPHAYQISLNSITGLRVYDVTDPTLPVRLTNQKVIDPNSITIGDPEGSGIHRYWLSTENGISPPSQLRLLNPLVTGGDFTGVDYLIITPADFTPALGVLVALREDQGLSVAIEDIQAIYDAFGDGRADPDALQAYLRYAYETWSIRPTYVLLVGDGTSDPKRYQSSSSITFIPAYLADVDPWAGETASDNRYVTLEGNDNLPEMLIGRLPANSLAETQTMISKIVQYSTNPEPGAWSGLANYFADDRDGAGNFPKLLDALITEFQGPTLRSQRQYFDPERDTGEEFHDRLEKTWNFGSGLMIYAGHASIFQWAAENFYHIEDISDLANGNRLPVILELTCFTGSFQVPGFETFDETLLRHPSGGVIAAWGSTGLGISTGQQKLAEGFLTDTFSEPASNLGSATLSGKLNLAVEGSYLDLIDTFTLLGDPAMHLFSTHYSFMPLIRR